jgi:hypothetical protein
MKRFTVWLLAVAFVGVAACAAQTVKQGSSPSVPKAAIEKAADTKIPDAGPDSGNTSAHAPY